MTVREKAEGDFYVENECCMACGVPESIAPELLGATDEENWQCYWKRQPQTPSETNKTIQILNTQELGCHRYSGTDPAILARLSPEDCDHPIARPTNIFDRRSTKARAVRFALIDEPQSFISRCLNLLRWKKR